VTSSWNVTHLAWAWAPCSIKAVDMWLSLAANWWELI
jgi:hypothetical protein